MGDFLTGNGSLNLIPKKLIKSWSKTKKGKLFNQAGPLVGRFPDYQQLLVVPSIPTPNWLPPQLLHKVLAYCL